MRYFLRSYLPAASRILVIESGSRQVIEQTIPHFRSLFGDGIEIDLVTCYAGEPLGLRIPATQGNPRVFNVNDYDGPPGRHKLLGDLLERQYPIVAVLCSAEPIMTWWKWWLGAKLPSKILIVNENGDFFWLDWARFDVVRKFVATRVGVEGGAAVPALIRLAFFPLIFAFLVLYAVTVHTRRRLRFS